MSDVIAASPDMGRHDSGCRTRMAVPPGVAGTAEFRGERDEHRIRLERSWDGGVDAPYALWIGMNPSAAEADRDDLTIRKECHWTRLLNLRRYVKANVGSYRWTDSLSLGSRGVPLSHPDNLPAILEMAAAASVVVVSVGNPPDALMEHARTTFRALADAGVRARCLGTTQDGWPRHSSRLGYATPFEDYRLARFGYMHTDGHDSAPA